MGQGNSRLEWRRDEKNILDKYDKTMINGSDFDPLSVMLYFFPSNLTMNHRGTHQNLRLSADDVIWIEKSYPGGSMSAKEYYPKVYGISLDKALKQEEMARKPQTLNIIVITIIMLVLFLLFDFFILKLRKHKK